jgi:hypothetical protein
MNIETLYHCIICLDVENQDQKLYPIPCACKAHIHKDCFQKIEGNECIICHQNNTYSDENKELKVLENTNSVKKININLETDDTIEEIQINFYQKIINNISQISKRLTLQCQNIFSTELYNDCNSIITCTLIILAYLIVTYLIGLLFRLICCLLNRVPLKEVFNDYTVFYHILSTFIAGLCIEFLLGMCSCCFNDEDEIYD